MNKDFPQNPPSWRNDTVLPLPPEVNANAWAVDAACSGNPGPMEYRCIDLQTGQQVFHYGPIHGTNNIGEFLAIVHALALMEQRGIKGKVIYSDSYNAALWVKKHKCKTTLVRAARTAKLHEVIARAVQQSLVSWGMDAFCVQDFSGVLAEFAVKNPQLVLMDIHLPFFNGFHWCQEIRKVSKVPVIFLSSASDNMNIIMAVNMGGDDFIAKPFDLSVLTAKVQAMLRRTYEFAGETNFLEHRGAMLDTGSGVLNYRGKRIELTKNEWRILQSLLENKGKAVSRDMLMMHLWESDSFIDDNTLTVNVTRLRKKLEEAGLTDFIQTKKGVGYLIA